MQPLKAAPNIYENAAVVKVKYLLKEELSPLVRAGLPGNIYSSSKRQEHLQLASGNQLTYLYGYRLGTPSR
jgi:hypothetical protein